MALTSKHLALVHVAKKTLAMNDDDYRALLWQVAEVCSAKELDEEGFEKVMRRFEALGFKSTRRQHTYGDRPGMATQAQVDFIRQLWRQYTDNDDEASLNHWLEHYFGVSTLRFADAHAAHQAIVALKSMVKRKARD